MIFVVYNPITDKYFIEIDLTLKKTSMQKFTLTNPSSSPVANTQLSTTHKQLIEELFVIKNSMSIMKIHFARTYLCAFLYLLIIFPDSVDRNLIDLSLDTVIID